MFSNENLANLDIKRICVAHRFVLDKTNKCAYPSGRGCYGLIYGIEGQAEYRFSAGHVCRVGEGDVLLLSPAAAYVIAVEHKFQHYTINFELADVLPLTDHCLLSCDHSEAYRQAFGALCSAWQKKEFGYELQTRGALYALLAQFAHDRYRRTHDSIDYHRLSPVKEYLEAHCCDAITLEQLSDLAAMSVTNFRREWGRLYGQTPIQYRDRLRILRAKEYLASGYYSVGEVAARCGFEDTAYFIRFFKRHTGISPGRFKDSSVLA